MFNEWFDKDVKIKKETSTQVKLTGDIARSCLSHDAFKTYREQYAKAELKVTDTLLAITEQYKSGHMELQEYGAKVLVYMTELKAIRSLLYVVEKDSKKGLENG
jgi:hypothetical protein